jgi:hypothetical protein
MFAFNNIGIQHTGISIIGALILAATSIGAAVGPARAIETSPIAYAQASQASIAVETRG